MLEASEEIFKNNARELTTQTAHLQKQIDNIRAAMHDLSTKFDQNSLNLKFLMQDAVSFTTLLIIDFKSKQAEFIEALTIGTGGINHQAFIPPHVLLWNC